MRPLSWRDAKVRAAVLLAAALVISAWTGKIFLDMHEPEPIVAGPGVTEQKMLSDYGSAVGAGDTPVYILEGEEPGGALLLIGGTHPQEVSGLLTAVLVIENVRVKQGRIVVIPQANRSGFTHTDPLEGFPHKFEIETPHGVRWFRLGMRLANPVHQWPDPDLFVHRPSGERMVGSEARNLNRNHPGRARGRFVERIAFAIAQVIRKEGVKIVLDTHEAYPEYPVINMLVAHEGAFDVGAFAVANLQERDIQIDLMASPKRLHGLSHREFGDHLGVRALLVETANPAMGRLRGRTDERLVVEGRDDNYVRAAKLDRLFVPFTAEGHPLSGRVARNMATLEEILSAYNEFEPDSPIIVEGLPSYDAVREQGLGPFLLPVPAASR